MTTMTGKKPECPDARTSQDSQDICDLNSKTCVLESGWGCPYYNEWLEEEKK